MAASLVELSWSGATSFALQSYVELKPSLWHNDIIWSSPTLSWGTFVGFLFHWFIEDRPIFQLQYLDRYSQLEALRLVLCLHLVHLHLRTRWVNFFVRLLVQQDDRISLLHILYYTNAFAAGLRSSLYALGPDQRFQLSLFSELQCFLPLTVKLFISAYLWFEMLILQRPLKWDNIHRMESWILCTCSIIISCLRVPSILSMRISCKFFGQSFSPMLVTQCARSASPC